MENIRIQDDLYTYVNQAKLDELVIPDDMPVAGSAVNLSVDVEKLMISEFNTMSAEGSYPNDHLARACTLFMDRRWRWRGTCLCSRCTLDCRMPTPKTSTSVNTNKLMVCGRI